MGKTKSGQRTFVAYYRVSTKGQGESGLGLAAQRQAVLAYVKGTGGRLLAEHTEIESGRRAKRPQLQAALAAARKAKATLIIAKLDRLARNVAFIANLMESHVDFVCVDNPNATPLTIHILAAVAEDEARRISQRTREALAQAKRNGRRLGPTGVDRARENKAAADEFARGMLPIIEAIRSAGFTSLRKITRELNRRAVPTPRLECRWHVTTTQALLRRQASLAV